MVRIDVTVPESLIVRLLAEARRQGKSTGEIARSALEHWLRDVEWKGISTYAAEMAGTPADLDEDLEEAGLEHLDDEERAGSA
ncbi:MAG: hypothetical protein ABFS86_00145 [Planctomycetota bacterium]